MYVRLGLWRKLSIKELMLLNCGVGENSWESLGVHPKGDQSWVFTGRTDAEAEIPILSPPHVKCWLIGKDSDAGRDWGQEENGTTEDDMAGWHHWLDGCESGWTLGVGDGQGGLVCCDSWGRKELDMTERLNWTELRITMYWAYSTDIWVIHWEDAVTEGLFLSTFSKGTSCFQIRFLYLKCDG